MRKLLVLTIAVFFLYSCGNNESTTTTSETKKDSTNTIRDSSGNGESGTVTPPASNGQY